MCHNRDPPARAVAHMVLRLMPLVIRVISLKNGDGKDGNSWQRQSFWLNSLPMDLPSLLSLSPRPSRRAPPPCLYSWRLGFPREEISIEATPILGEGIEMRMDQLGKRMQRWRSTRQRRRGERGHTRPAARAQEVGNDAARHVRLRMLGSEEELG